LVITSHTCALRDYGSRGVAAAVSRRRQRPKTPQQSLYPQKSPAGQSTGGSASPSDTSPAPTPPPWRRPVAAGTFRERCQHRSGRVNNRPC